MSHDCFDCRQAALRDWCAYSAGCRGCIARALAGIKCKGKNCTAPDTTHSPECIAEHAAGLFLPQPEGNQ